MQGVEVQPRQDLEALRAIRMAGGTSPDHVVKVTVPMTCTKGIAKMNDTCRTQLSTHPPARSCLEVKGLVREGLEGESEYMAAS
jgi:2-iminobutanoate/2-iminopropanoate deaminase